MAGRALNIGFLDLAADLVAGGFDFLLSAEGASLLINSLRRPDIRRPIDQHTSRDFA